MGNSNWDAAKGCLLIIIGLPLLVLVCGGLSYLIEPIRDFFVGLLPIILIVILIITLIIYRND